MKKQTLRLALLQSELYWESVEDNLHSFSDQIRRLPEADLIVLPEMFSTGFSMAPERLAEKNRMLALTWMEDVSRERSCALCGSLCVEDQGKFVNRFFGFQKGALDVRYDKRHLFSLAGEEKKYTAGIQQVYWEVLGWRLMPLICYDLRFPAWSRNDGSVDLYLYVANWPEKRIAAWDTLLRARAMENMAYVAGVNRVGVDGNGMAHSGSSQVFDVLGHSLGRCPDNQQEALVVDLSMEALAENRKRFGFLQDRDRFTLQG